MEPPVVELPPGVEEPPVIELPPLEEGPDLEKEKIGPAECVEGDICTFTITITNNGPGIWSGPLWEVDTLPAGAILWDYAPQPDWTCNQVGQNVFCTYLWVTLAPGEFVTLTLDVLLPFGIAGQVIENCIADIWLPSDDPTDPAVIWAIEQALAALGYVVGPIDGVLDIVTMNAIAQFQADNGLPVTWVPDQDLLDLMFAGNAAAFGDADPDNDQSCAQVLVTPAPILLRKGAEPDLEIDKRQLERQCRPGELCSFELRLINRGPGDWTGYPAITDTLPAGSTLVSSSAWLCAQTGDQVTCQSPFEVTLSPNETRTIILTVRMPDNLRPGAQNCAEVDWPAGVKRDPNANNDRDCDPVKVGEAIPDLEPRKVQHDAPCEPGGTCSFDLWLVNRGPGAWTGIPRLQDQLPPGAVLQSGTGCKQSGSTVICVGSQTTLPPGRGVRVTVTVKMPPELKPGTKNCVRIQQVPGTKRDPVPQNDQHCIPVEISTPTLPPPPPPPPPGSDTSIEKI